MTRRHIGCCIAGLILLSACEGDLPKHRSFFEDAFSQQPRIQIKPSSKPLADRTFKSPDNASPLHLLKAETLIQAGDSQTAQKHLDLIRAADLSDDQQQKLNLLYAQTYLSFGDAEQALIKLAAIQTRRLSNIDQVSYYQSTAFAQALAGNVLASITARINLDELPLDLQLKNNNRNAILETLASLPDRALAEQQAIQPATLAGWMALARITKQKSQNTFDGAAALAGWQQKFPQHPAEEFARPLLLGTVTARAPKSPDQATSNIAILLPESGPHAPAAKAIKEGIMAAYHLQNKTSQQPTIKFYNTQQGDIVTVYQQALSEGAKTIIGPLLKEEIQALSIGRELPIPVLALNHVENLSQKHLYQFGLSPIDEAEQITERARRDGHRTAAILTPNNPQGQRIGNYLADFWQHAGGKVTAAIHYDSKQRDFGPALQQLLNLDESQQRHEKLQQSLERELAFIPRKRQDIDAILINASTEVARSLIPQLRYQQASDLVSYAMPNIYSGQPDATRDADLNKVVFCDAPWFFTDTYSGELSQEALRSTWQPYATNQLRLIALGLDAYRLAGQIETLEQTPFSGATGQLSLTTGNRVARRLHCAQFDHGIPVSLSP